MASWYGHSGISTITNSLAVTKEDCGHTEYSEVCGVDGTTYSTLCHLQQRGVKLAYSGPCRPALCHGAVCGRDGVTYPSSCHARAHNVRVDYKGTCFAEESVILFVTLLSLYISFC